jgi:hypothetical protein
LKGFKAMQEGEKLDGAGKGRLLKTRRRNYLRASIPLAIACISENAHILFFSEIRITTGSKTHRGGPTNHERETSSTELQNAVARLAAAQLRFADAHATVRAICFALLAAQPS